MPPALITMATTGRIKGWIYVGHNKGRYFWEHAVCGVEIPVSDGAGLREPEYCTACGITERDPAPTAPPMWWEDSDDS